MVAKVLGKTGSPIKACAMMYNVVVNTVLLYGRKIWVVKDAIMTVLEVFCNSIDIRILGITVRKGYWGEWGCSLVDVALETTGIWPIREYVRRRQATIAEYISGRPI